MSTSNGALHVPVKGVGYHLPTTPTANTPKVRVNGAYLQPPGGCGQVSVHCGLFGRPMLDCSKRSVRESRSLTMIR